MSNLDAQALQEKFGPYMDKVVSSKELFEKTFASLSTVTKFGLLGYSVLCLMEKNMRKLLSQTARDFYENDAALEQNATLVLNPDYSGFSTSYSEKLIHVGSYVNFLKHTNGKKGLSRLFKSFNEQVVNAHIDAIAEAKDYISIATDSDQYVVQATGQAFKP